MEQGKTVGGMQRGKAAKGERGSLRKADLQIQKDEEFHLELRMPSFEFWFGHLQTKILAKSLHLFVPQFFIWKTRMIAPPTI